MLDQGQRRAILELRRRGTGVRAIARAMGLSRKVVRKVLRADSAEVPPPSHDKTPAASATVHAQVAASTHLRETP